MVVDIILLAVLAVAIFIGWKRGLVLSIFLLGSTIISIILASLLSPFVSAGLDKLGVADAMAPKFSSYVEEAMLEEYNQTGAMDVEAAADSLPLPSFLSNKVAENINESAADSIESIAGKIGAEAADMVCTVISFAIVFISSRLARIFLIPSGPSFKSEFINFEVSSDVNRPRENPIVIASI